jgi:succinyl-diaminopimelate desuccinylase
MKKLHRTHSSHRHVQTQVQTKMKTEEVARELMKYKTVSPVEKPEIFQYLKGLLEEHGIDADIHEIDGVYNLTAETGEGEPSICLNGHLDVVEPEGQWSVTEPFEPVIEDGKLYGRGASDMKAAFAAQVKAFIDLHKDSDFNGRAVLMAAGDEEIGGFKGSQPLVDKYYGEEQGFDYAIVGEATDMNVQVGTRGVVWLNIQLEGEGIHASRADLAQINIMEELPNVLDRLNNMKLTYENNGTLPDPSHEVTRVETTQTYNSVPGELEIGMDIRYLPSQNIDQIVEDVEKALEGIECGFRVEVEQDHGGAFELSDEKFREASVKALEEVRGERPEEITDGGASDGRFFAEKDTPFIELGTNQKTVHGENEMCEVETLKKLRNSYYGISKRLAE